MKQSWTAKALAAVSAIDYGYTDSASNSAIGPHFLRITDIQDDGVDWGTVPYCKIDPAELPRYSLASGDIVFARTGATTGKSFLVRDPPKAIFASYLIRLRLLDRTLLPEFVSLFFQTDGYWNSIRTGSTGSAQGGFNATKLGALFVPIPPPSEQERIVSILDEAFRDLATVRTHTEKNIVESRAIFESYRQSVFSQWSEGWATKRLAELCDIKHGFAFKSEFFTDRGDYILLTPGNFYESGGYRDRGEKQKYYSGEIPEGFVLSEGDMLVAMTEQAKGLLGSPILVPESGKFLHNQRLGLVSRKPGVAWTNEFFFHVFNTDTVRKAVHASASGVKVRHTSPTKIGEISVRFPTSIDAQRAIVSTLKSLSLECQRLESVYERKLAALETLKRSLLHQAFAGHL